MGLEISTLEYRGRQVVVKPVYGWGWSRLDAPETPVPAEVNGVPSPFRARIHEFFGFNRELRGVVARIEEPYHIYDGLWTVFYTRVGGTLDFTERLPYCNIEIGVGAPIGEWPEIVSGSPRIGGYCFVGESLEHLAAHHLRLCGMAGAEVLESTAEGKPG